jgi:flagellar protein FliS
MNNKLKAYEQANTLGLSQLDLILKVYDGAIGSFKKAKEYYQTQKLNEGHEELEKARRFVTHLYTTLDPEKGGEIAEKLGKIYVYLLNQINQAQATKELRIIDDNISVLSNLREGWQYLKRQQKGDKKAENAAADVESARKIITSA